MPDPRDHHVVRAVTPWLHQTRNPSGIFLAKWFIIFHLHLDVSLINKGIIPLPKRYHLVIFHQIRSGPKLLDLIFCQTKKNHGGPFGWRSYHLPTQKKETRNARVDHGLTARQRGECTAAVPVGPFKKIQLRNKAAAAAAS